MALRKLCLWNLAAHALLLSWRPAGASRQQPLLGNEKGNGPFDEDFDRLANETLHRWKCPGLSIAVVDGDQTYAKGYGMATFPSMPVEASTLFLVGSTTKAFTAAAMSLLVDDDDNYPSLQWNSPISELIRDDFVLEEGYATTHITIEDALSHRSGMPRHDMSYGGQYDGHYVTSRDVVRSLRYLPLTAELRTKWQYCNMMYVVASYIIETFTKSWVGDIIRTRILEPLDMKSTYFSTTAAQKAPEHLAQGYYYHNGSYHEVPHMELHQVSGAGFMVSNVLDYTKWIRAMIDQAPPVSKAGHKSIKTPRMLYPGFGDDSAFTGPSAYSLGWIVSVYNGYEVYQHDGGMEAFGALVVFFPKLRYGLVAFGNIGGWSNIAEEALIWHLVDRKLGIEDSFDWNKKNQKSVDERESFLGKAKSTFYPSIPSPPLPLSLPLQSYTGTYSHPAYKNMTITLAPSTSSTTPRLHIDRTDVTWKMKLDLEHVSGEHFIAWVDSLVAPHSIFKTALPAEFRLSKDGAIAEFGARMEEMMGDEKIWFKRI